MSAKPWSFHPRFIFPWLLTYSAALPALVLLCCVLLGVQRIDYAKTKSFASMKEDGTFQKYLAKQRKKAEGKGDDEPGLCTCTTFPFLCLRECKTRKLSLICVSLTNLHTPPHWLAPSPHSTRSTHSFTLPLLPSFTPSLLRPFTPSHAHGCGKCCSKQGCAHNGLDNGQ